MLAIYHIHHKILDFHDLQYNGVFFRKKKGKKKEKKQKKLQSCQPMKVSTDLVLKLNNLCRHCRKDPGKDPESYLGKISSIHGQAKQNKSQETKWVGG